MSTFRERFEERKNNAQSRQKTVTAKSTFSDRFKERQSSSSVGRYMIDRVDTEKAAAETYGPPVPSNIPVQPTVDTNAIDEAVAEKLKNDRIGTSALLNKKSIPDRIGSDPLELSEESKVMPDGSLPKSRRIIGRGLNRALLKTVISSGMLLKSS